MSITAEQRNKLEELADEYFNNECDVHSDDADLAFKNYVEGAEALARIQSESVSTETRSDEEAAEYYATRDKEYDGIVGAEMDAFLAGCARYRPLVEEMLAALTAAVKHWGDYSPQGGNARKTLDKCKPLIVRAERLLSGTKEQFGEKK